MNSEVDNLVRRVLRHGIELKERLRRGEEFDLKNEQAVIKRMLLTEEQARQIPDYASDTANYVPTDLSYGSSGYGSPMAPERTGTFLGIRYALVCWLDEMFLIDSPWDSEWNENKLELALYGSNDRAWKFWEQAQLADKRPTKSALRAFFLCAMLGFRGDYRDNVAALTAWVDATRKRLSQDEPGDWIKPPDREIRTAVPPLFGRESLRRMIIACGSSLLILVPIVAFFFIRYLDQTTPTRAATREGPRASYGQDLSEEE